MHPIFQQIHNLNFVPNETAANAVFDDYHHGRLPILSADEFDESLKAAYKVAEIAKSYKQVVLFGTGGSSLSAIAFNTFAAVTGRKHLASLKVVDTIDPYVLKGLFESVSFRETLFICVSKSGGTAETLLQTNMLVEAMKLAGHESWLASNIIFVTEPKQSDLYNLAIQLGSLIIPHPPRIGGRYSVFTAVGMIPAAICGLDVQAIRNGAEQVFGTFSELSISDAAIAASAIVASGKSISVVMPYASALADFSRWYRQLWAESIGKKGLGITPVDSLGPVDQHSQLQLYLDGPLDKVYTIISIKNFAGDTRAASMISAMQQATEQTMIRHNLPVRSIQLESLDEKPLGALFAHFIIETIVAAKILGVNAFDQPAVEEGKQLAAKILGRVA